MVLAMIFVLLLWCTSSIASSIRTSSYFVNPKYTLCDGDGHARVNVSRSGVGFGGLKTSKLIPCTPDAEIPFEIVVDEIERTTLLAEEGFELSRLCDKLIHVILEERNNFVSTLNNVMDTAKHSSFARVQRETFMSWNPFQLRGNVVFCLTCEGFIVRKVLPGGAPASRSFGGGAQGMHIDQDLNGEPLQSMGVSWLFRFVPFLNLVNIWTPLKESPIRPLVLMDRRTLKMPFRHSWGNDIILIGHHPDQKYYFSPSMPPKSAFVFLTGFTPHTSASVPGEHCLLARNNTHEPCPMATREIRNLLEVGNFSDWVRESLEMRCAILVFSEQYLLYMAICLSVLIIAKSKQLEFH